MGTLIYLDHFRPQEPDLPPNTLCGGMRTPYVVDPSVPPKTPGVIVRVSFRPHRQVVCLTLLLRKHEEPLNHEADLMAESEQLPSF